MVRELRSYPLIAGDRHEPPLDEEAFVRMISAVCRMFLSDPRIAEFDINPLILYEKGGCAVDARFYTDDAAASALHQEPVREVPEELFRYPFHCRCRGIAGSQ